ncbi:Thioredoxin O1, mitochondrial [Linum perenne]
MQGKSPSETMKWNSVIGTILRRGASNLLGISSPSILLETATPLASVISSPSFPISRKLFAGNPSFATTAADFHVSSPLQFNRSFSSSAGSSNVVPIKTEEEFNSSMKNVQDKSLPAVYYFTAVWCGPCKFISPVITQLSEEYPHVPTYKIDIDQICLYILIRLTLVPIQPTLHFYQNGKKTAEIVGADVARLKETMEELYG